MLLWILSVVLCFLFLMVLFKLDHKLVDGATRDFVDFIDGGVIIMLVAMLFPFINMVMCVIITVIFIVMVFTEKLDIQDGEDFIKLIFFIKDKKGKWGKKWQHINKREWEIL